jgi:hypothetical protein
MLIDGKYVDSPKTLIFSQDPGGASFLAPAVVMLCNGGLMPDNILILAHPFSEKTFNENSVPYVKLDNEIKSCPVSVHEWECFLKQKNICTVVTSTSSPYIDLTNCNLIEACRKKKCPTIGVLDHWKGMDRFFREKELVYLPDEICCIDEYCRNAIAKLGLNKKHIHIVGHPSLERVSANVVEKEFLDSKIVNILLVSQPFILDRSFKGIFFLKHNGRRIIEIIGEVLKNIFDSKGIKAQINLRPHPKEYRGEVLPNEIELDPFSKWSDSLTNHQIFIGYDSMALIEASVIGKPNISMNLPVFRNMTERFSFNYGYSVNNFSNLEKIIIGLFTKDLKIKENFFIPTSYQGSTKKLYCSIVKFIKI